LKWPSLRSTLSRLLKLRILSSEITATSSQYFYSVGQSFDAAGSAGVSVAFTCVCGKEYAVALLVLIVLTDPAPASVRPRTVQALQIITPSRRTIILRSIPANRHGIGFSRRLSAERGQNGP
jgi:hypothetical protein